MLHENFVPFVFAYSEAKKYKFFFVTSWSKYVKVRKKLPDHLIDVLDGKVKVYFKSKRDARKAVKLIKALK